jgi:hypothetical protein
MYSLQHTMFIVREGSLAGKWVLHILEKGAMVDVGNFSLRWPK